MSTAYIYMSTYLNISYVFKIIIYLLYIHSSLHYKLIFAEGSAVDILLGDIILLTLLE